MKTPTSPTEALQLGTSSLQGDLPPTTPHTNEIRLRSVVFALITTVLLGSSWIAVLKPEWRSSLHNWLLPGERTVLSTVTADILNDGRSLKVVKVRYKRQIQLEIYSRPNKKMGYRLIQTIPLMDKRDGFFHLGGQAVNLALADLDNDGIKEIISPTFDHQLSAHLNVLRYNEFFDSFEFANGDTDLITGQND